MKVLFDENLGYKRHAASLVGHDVFSNKRMGWEGLPDHVVVEKAVSHGFHAIVSKDRDGELEKANASLGNPLCIVPVPVPKDVRREQVEEEVKKHMPEVLKRLNEHQRTLDQDQERKTREQERGPEGIRTIVERVTQGLGVTLPRQQEPPKPDPQRADRELKQFDQEVRGLCDQIARSNKDRGPERAEATHQIAPEPEKRPGLARANEMGMVRHILCIPCREFVRDENEPDKVVVGLVKLPDTRCDRCSDPLPIGAEAAAASFYDSPERYRPWEHEQLAVGEPKRGPVRMSLDGYDPTNLNDACHFAGVFHRKAIEQGWSVADATEAVTRVSAKQAFEQLRQHIEPTPPEPLTWRTQIDRINDYKRGFQLLNDDPNVKPNPFGWWLRGYGRARWGQGETLAQDTTPRQEPAQEQEQKSEHDIKPRHNFRIKF